MIIFKSSEKEKENKYNKHFDFEIEWCIDKLLGQNAFSIKRTAKWGSWHPRRQKNQIELSQYTLTGIISDKNISELKPYFKFAENITGEQITEQLNNANQFVIDNFKELFECTSNKSKEVYDTLKFQTFEEVANSDSLKEFFAQYDIVSLEDRVNYLKKCFLKIN